MLHSHWHQKVTGEVVGQGKRISSHEISRDHLAAGVFLVFNCSTVPCNALHHVHLNSCKICHDPKRNHVLAQTQAPHALYRVTWSKRDREEVESPRIVVQKNECKSETLGIGTPRLCWLNFEGERAKVSQNYNNIWHLLRRACAACRGAKSCFLG